MAFAVLVFNEGLDLQYIKYSYLGGVKKVPNRAYVIHEQYLWVYSMATSSCISRVRRGRLAPRNRATGPPRAQNRKVGRISLKSRKYWSCIAQFWG